MGIYNVDDGWEFGRESYMSGRKYGKPMGPGAPHYPNTAERVLLTQMMQRSGQTEEQVRNDKSNRQKLAGARKSMCKPGPSLTRKGSRQEFEAKRRLRQAAAWAGVEVWQLKEKYD